MKSLKETQHDVAKECGEDHFELLLQCEIDVGDYGAAKKLLTTVTDRYINQFSVEINRSTEALSKQTKK